jgi:hypothetical protein
MEVAMQKEDFFKGINQIEVNSGLFKTKYPIFYREVSYLGLFSSPLLTKLETSFLQKE